MPSTTRTRNRLTETEREANGLWGLAGVGKNRGTSGRWVAEHPELAGAMRRVCHGTATDMERALVGAWCDATVRRGLGLPEEGVVVVPDEKSHRCGDCGQSFRSAAGLGAHRHHKHSKSEPASKVAVPTQLTSGKASPPSLEPGRPPLVLVRWRDAYFDFDREGRSEPRSDYVVETVGWLTRQDDTWIEITSERLPDEGGRAVSTIPRVLVSGAPILLVEPS